MKPWVYAIWGALIWVAGLMPVIVTLTSPRNPDLAIGELITNLYASQGGLSRLVYLGTSGLALGLGAAALLLGLASRGGRLPRAGLGLWLGAMALALGPLISSRLGLKPGFSLELFSLPVLFTAVYLLPPVSLAWFVRQAKAVLLVYAYGSLLTALVVPRWALQHPYTEGLIPGLDIRLFGITAHANYLAALLLTYLILDWFSSSKIRWGRFHQVIVLLALLLTQSKTVWALVVLAYLIRLAYMLGSLPRIQRYSVFSLIGAVFGGGVLYLALGPAWLDGVESAFSGAQLSTLTSRTLIWHYTLGLWEQNPWFGYGPDLWDTEMQLRYASIAYFVIAHAHNQFFQSLGEAGIVGVVGLLLYIVGLLVYAVRFAKVTNVVAVALVLMMLLRGITEVPLLTILADINFYIHFLTFTFLVLASRQYGWRTRGRMRAATPQPGSPIVPIYGHAPSRSAGDELTPS